MNADQARNLKEKYDQTLLEPFIENIFPYIERTANLGGTQIHYLVSTEAKRTPQVKEELENLGYLVDIIQQPPTHTLLFIRW